MTLSSGSAAQTRSGEAVEADDRGVVALQIFDQFVFRERPPLGAEFGAGIFGGEFGFEFGKEIEVGEGRRRREA